MACSQAFVNPYFYLSILGVTILSFISIWEELSVWGSKMSIVYYFDIFVGLTMFKKLVVLFAAVPYVSSFCNDWKYQYIKPTIIRTGIKSYLWSKVTACFLSGFLTVFTGLILFTIILSFKIPVFPAKNIDQLITPPFAELAYGSFPIMYLLAQMFIFSMAAALWAVVGLTVSAFIPVQFVALAAPVIASYFLEELSMLLPKWLNLYYLTRSAEVIHQGPYISFGYYCLVFILYSALAALLFGYQVKRRVHNEVI